MGKVKVDIRDISPFLRTVRNLLLGREHTLALRFDKDVATRSPPLPDIPGGPAHRLNSNYYYSRDARREVQPPTVIQDAQAQLAAECPPEKTKTGQRRPGNVFQWD